MRYRSRIRFFMLTRANPNHTSWMKLHILSPVFDVENPIVLSNRRVFEKQFFDLCKTDFGVVSQIPVIQC